MSSGPKSAPIRPEDWFERGHLVDNMKERSVKGGLRTVGAQLFSFSTNLLTTIFLARLLLPEDYGVVAMVTSFTGFILIFKDLGIAQAVISQDGLTQRLVSELFWFNVLISFVLALLIAGSAPLVVWFYEESRLAPITLAYAGIAILGGLSVQHQALLSRQMQFQRISSITMQAAFFSLIPALVMAYLGAGYWALVAISALNSLITCLLLWRKCSWRPDFHWPSARIKSFLGFGAGISGFNIINYFSRNLDNILIGKYLGSDPLGLYSKAYQLLMLPITQLRDPLNSVGIPAMSSLRAEPGRYKHYYNQFLFFMAFFSMPITLFLLVNAEALILIALGAQWAEAIGIFQLLAITAFIQPVASTRGMVMISSGLSTRYFYWGLANAIVVTIAFLIGIRFGLSGIAIAYAIANYLILIPSLYYCFAKTPVTVGQFLRSILAPACTALFAAGMNYLALHTLSAASLWLQLGIGLLSFGLSYLGLWALLPPLRPRLKELLTIAKSIKKKP